MQIVTAGYDHPDAQKLDAEVQLEYAERYASGGDISPLSPEMFEPPNGLFVLVYDDSGRPVGTGGWRSQERNGEGYSDGDAEIKRMYVIPGARGQGLARKILAVLEESARAAGRVRMVLETGIKQPEAIELYTSSGYEPVKKFGFYRDYDDSRCFAKLL
ncbi:GNAT family N-acetyltransferase [Streptomyces gobiensis]|uniref:GNAT family N-acetyltransferase n=1 Tax=Streptomyces gobiensis TaxID=2875706 RepID=UPI001E2EDFD6|nr:GNAT family N-acetyltransferase [Streptomyces gobiensis]UGY91884.1 GNAT family N-acetyltransferase [Streptomyces gobiensis]